MPVLENPLDALKVEAEIAKLNAETVKLHAEQMKLNEESRKLSIESRKLTREIFWYPVAISTALIGTVAGVTVALTRLMGA